MESVVVYSQPFLRYQSEDCPVWFEGHQDVSTLPVLKCPSCQEVIKTLGRQMSSIKRKKRKQEGQLDVEDTAYREEVVEATVSII